MQARPAMRERQAPRVPPVNLEAPPTVAFLVPQWPKLIEEPMFSL